MAWFIVQSLITLVLAFALGIAVGWLVWARRRPAGSGVSAEPAAAEEQLAACTCAAGAPSAGDVDLDADDVDLDPDADMPAEDADVEPRPGEAGDAPAAAEDVDVEDLVATYEGLEEIDTDLDSPTFSTDVTDEAETDKDDVAALAVAVGALTTAVGTDDIERIEGIGPKIGKALRSAGLDTYTAIAEASQESLREAIKAGGVKVAPSVESWSSQARLLADGDEAGFEAFTGRLLDGRTKA